MRWKANPEIIVQRLGESMVLVDLSSDQVLQLNDSAATMFEMLEEGARESELESRMSELFDVDRSVLRQEIRATLSELSARQLVTSEV